MNRFLKLLVLLTLLLVAGVGAVTARWWKQEALAPFGAAGGERVIFRVEPGESGRDVHRRLAADGLVRSELVARLVHRFRLDGRPVRVGEYAFSGPLTAVQVLERIVEGRSLTYPVTLREGLDRWQVAETVAAALDWITEEEMTAAVADPASISDLASAVSSLEGFLFPETYAFPRGASAQDVVVTMTATFRRVWQEEQERLGGEQRDPLRVVTLASIVEAETGVPEERPRIAAVFLNRLNRGMKLQADPTVIYAVKLQGRWDGNIRSRDLTMEHPYNTYSVGGLPPGPIGNPGRAAIRAVLSPLESRELYFVSRNDGSHVFSENYRDHQRAVREYWRRRRAAGT